MRLVPREFRDRGLPPVLPTLQGKGEAHRSPMGGGARRRKGGRGRAEVLLQIRVESGRRRVGGSRGVERVPSLWIQHGRDYLQGESLFRAVPEGCRYVDRHGPARDAPTVRVFGAEDRRPIRRGSCRGQGVGPIATGGAPAPRLLRARSAVKTSSTPASARAATAKVSVELRPVGGGAPWVVVTSIVVVVVRVLIVVLGVGLVVVLDEVEVVVRLVEEVVVMDVVDVVVLEDVDVDVVVVVV